MSTRRKFVITLNLIALVIAALLFSIYRYASLASPSSLGHAVEMQLVPLPALNAHVKCAPSCVITSRAALGIASHSAQ
ncbi:hypothetical protein [Herminiimonas arsenitoxidans]|uniref:hypothetical protein n=1 Tax=Herminiimonas arsenitoxidans TaxID=1809410 RepID=UPI000970AFC2|nr:hypothetical protein [Herminiimonas arsenitoxidans]